MRDDQQRGVSSSPSGFILSGECSETEQESSGDLSDDLPVDYPDMEADDTESENEKIIEDQELTSIGNSELHSTKRRRFSSGYTKEEREDISRRYLFPRRRPSTRTKERGYLLKKIKRERKARKGIKFSESDSEISKSPDTHRSKAFITKHLHSEKHGVESISSIDKALANLPTTSSVCSHCFFSLKDLKAIPLLKSYYADETKKYHPFLRPRFHKCIGYACSPLCAISYAGVRNDKALSWTTRAVLNQFFKSRFYGLPCIDNCNLQPLNPNGINPRDKRFIEHYVTKYTPKSYTLFTDVRKNDNRAFPVLELYSALEKNNVHVKSKQTALDCFFK